MANFRTHVVGAALPAAAAAGAVAATGLVRPSAALVCAFFGALGGVLPDLDAPNSVPTRWIFTAVALTAAVAAAAATTTQGLRGLGEVAPAITTGTAGTVAVAIVAFVAAFVGVRLGGPALLGRLCVHRGLVHSLPIAALAGAGVVALAVELFAAPRATAWLLGGFLSAGFVVHLLLDELFSVDLAGARLRRSFGSALKLGSRSNWLGTLVVYAALALLLRYLAAEHPPPRGLVRGLIRGLGG